MQEAGSDSPRGHFQSNTVPNIDPEATFLKKLDKNEIYGDCISGYLGFSNYKVQFINDHQRSASN